MTVTPNTQAVLLLTSHFSKSSGDAAKPLTPKEWGRFAVWLKDHALTPEQLMGSHTKELLIGWSDRKITLNRLESLLDRGSALAIAMEKWLRAGLWVMTRSDTDYPARLKKRLGTDSPPVIYGCGNRALLNSGGLAVVGSRNAADDDLEYARLVGGEAANQGYSIVSGGARGIDETAMLGALEGEGTAVGVVANGLLSACSSSKYRSHLVSRNLVLTSTFHPEAGFNAGNAMQRNKYIYCLSDAALAVHSGVKGGTWNGATENLQKGWVPLWVKPTGDPSAGNDGLAKRGARWASENAGALQIRDLFLDDEALVSEPMDLLTAEEPGPDSSIPSRTAPPERPDIGPPLPSSSAKQSTTPLRSDPACSTDSGNTPPAMSSASADSSSGTTSGAPPLSDATKSNVDITFYGLFLREISKVCASSAKTPDELAELLDINKTQVNVWLRRALAEKRLRKLSKPVRYEWVDTQQASLFEA